MEILIKNCMVIDGTGAPAYAGSVGFDSGRLRVFRKGERPQAKQVIDARGLTLVPGFIDAHSHGDLTMTGHFATRSKLSQGFTMQIAGQCGASMFPVSQNRRELFSQYISGIAPHPDFPDELMWLQSAAGYFEWLKSLDNPIITKSFVGHGTLRLWAMGYENRKPDATELRCMQSMLRRCMREGALGLSVGMVYAPGCYADNEELLALLHVVKEEGGYFAMHPRNEADTVEQARAESISLAGRADVPLCVSHMKAAGRDNWGKPRNVLRMIDQAAQDGQRLLIDSYPYTAGCTSLNVSIPPRYFSDGMEGLVAALSDKAEREIIRSEMSSRTDYENYIYNCGGFDGVFVSSCPIDHGAEGMFITEYAETKDMDPFDAYCDILIKNQGLGLGIYFHMSEDDVVEILTHPLCVIGTDGLIGLPSENPHPRTHGTSAHAYDLLVRKKKLLTPEQMIHKLSGQTADFLQLADKGRIQDGYDADVLLLDLDEFSDTATYRNGAGLCRGIKNIYIGGRSIDLGSYTV
jgi:N-acyl-D-amino-acid deacylase